MFTYDQNLAKNMPTDAQHPKVLGHQEPFNADPKWSYIINAFLGF